jgi:hypothetical protein
LAYAGGEVLSGTVEENHLKIEANNIHVSVEKVNAVTRTISPLLQSGLLLF